MCYFSWPILGKRYIQFSPAGFDIVREFVFRIKLRSQHLCGNICSYILAMVRNKFGLPRPKCISYFLWRWVCVFDAVLVNAWSLTCSACKLTSTAAFAPQSLSWSDASFMLALASCIWLCQWNICFIAQCISVRKCEQHKTMFGLNLWVAVAHNAFANMRISRFGEKPWSF